MAADIIMDLFTTAGQGTVDEVRRIVNKGVDVNTSVALGTQGLMTPLLTAVRYNRNAEEVAKFLISQGANVNAKQENGMSSLFYAMGNGSVAVAELLISHGADVNARLDDGCTPLHIAAEKGQDVIARSLISKGANVNAKNNRGHAPLAIAEHFKHTAVAQYIRSQGGR